MRDDLPLPPHLKQAQAQLLAANLPAEALPHALTALQLAADCYHATPQVNHATVLRQERDKIQSELEQVSADLLAARRQNRELRHQLREHQTSQPSARQEIFQAADQKIAAYMSIVTRLGQALHELARLLNHTKTAPEAKISAAKRLVGEMLAGSTNRKHQLLAARLLAGEAE